MTLDQLKTFQMVAAERSFGRAAELLHLTQPAISKQIQALETELDQRLFERGRKVQITAAGMTLLRHVEQLGHILRAAHDEMADLRELRSGYLRIGAAHSIATYVLPNLIEAYRSRHPKVNLAIESAWSAELTARVLKHDLDFALLVQISPDLDGATSLKAVPLAAMELVFVVSADLALAKKKNLAWDDLDNAPLILNQEGCVYRRYIEQRLKERGKTMKVEVEVIGLELQKKLTQLGLGVSLLPKNFVAAEISSGALRPLRLKETRLQSHHYLVFRRDKYIAGPMKAFLRLLGENFAPAREPLKFCLEPA